uniref:Actin interacting protein 3-like C-terminal domain-containing protein n=1 Tax=Pygocentrus nattereri TaxID=42514 RepID=A0AAR2IRY0_PYGNA
MSKPSRLARPPSATPGSKLPSPHRDRPAARPRTSQEEKLMQTGSEGNLSHHSTVANGATQAHKKGEEEASQRKIRGNPPKGVMATVTQQPGAHHKPLKGNLKVTSPEDAEHLHRKQTVGDTASAGSSSNSPGIRRDPKGSRPGVPRRHTVGGARSSREILAMQPSEMDKKREAFLEHLKQKYPHHASAIMGHQERLREQTRSPKQGAAVCLCPSPVPSCGEQLEQGSLSSLDSLEVMSECDAPLGFTRGTRSRASLPVVRTANQTKDRSLGVLYLQYGDDMKQIRMPNEITSADTVRALFVSAFPLQLSMKMLESPSTAIYVKDDMRNMYYELSDIRSITDQACLKVYHKDPVHAFNHGARPNNGDPRMHKEVVYVGPPLLRQHSLGPSLPHTMQGSMPPPTPHSMPPSPSRIPFGPRVSGGATTMPRERSGHNLATTTRSASPCPSAILERRDVKPDEDVAAKSMSLPARGEGLYADPYMMQHPDMVDHAYHRSPVRPYGPTGKPTEPVEHPSLFRQKSRKHADSQLPTLGSKTPPPSPHRMGEMRVMDIHGSQSQAAPLERSSPIRQSFRKEAPVNVEMVVKGRSVMASPGTPDLQSHCPLVPSPDPQTRDRSVKSGSPVHSTSSPGDSPVLGPKNAINPPERSPASTSPISSAPLQVNLLQLRKNVSELRVQMQQMRQLQLQTQDCVRAQIKQAEQELSVRLAEALRRQEDPAHKQRMLVEEERHKYLCMEERVLTELGDLENYVESLQRDSSSGVALRVVTLKEVEEGAVSLRKVGESLAGLKGEFPALQARMRAVLRVEVEAVKFLKEEPHKLDSMLKRVKTLTDSLNTLRRCTTEGLLKPSDPATTADGIELGPPSDIQDSASMPLIESQSSSVRSEVINSNPMVIHHAQSSPVPPCQSQHSIAPSTSTSELPYQTHEFISSSTMQSGSAGQLRKSSLSQPEFAPPSSNIGIGVSDSGASPSLFIEEITSYSKGKNRATSIEAAEREWEEKRQNMGHYDGQEFQKMLQEAEANMMRGIPSLEVANEGDRMQKHAAVHPAVLEEVVEKPEPSALPAHEDSQPESPTSEKPTKTSPEKAPKPHLGKAPKAAALDKPPKPSITAKASLERATKLQDKTAKLCQGSDMANKSPPPPPPRRNYPTTTHSGQVTCTSRKESSTAQEGEGKPLPKLKSPPETKPKPCTPPPFTASAIPEENEGDKIMAELQVFQKCSNKDIGVKGLVEPQIKELRLGALLPLKDKKNTEILEDKDLVTDENGNSTVRQSPGVIYYVTAQITKDTSEDTTDHRLASQPTPSQNTSVASPTSRMPVPVSGKTRQQPGTSDRERAAKQQKLQDSQRQFRQANGSAKRSGGDPKSTSPTLPASKIPAFSSSIGKGASQSDATNPLNSSSIIPPFSSSNKSSIPTPRSIPAPSSQIPSLTNGSLKLGPPPHSTKGLSLSTQTQNGRPPSSSSPSHSPLSPTLLTQGAKSIRTIHTPSFVSYSRPHNGSAGKSAIPMATVAKDAS